MKYSNNYGLALPEDDDFYDINPISENFAALDEALAETAAETETISDRIGIPPTGETVVSMLAGKKESSVIKSIRHELVTLLSSENNTTHNIDPVDPSKTFAIMERLRSTHDFNITYSLSENAITISHGTYSISSGGEKILGFWIIEFC